MLKIDVAMCRCVRACVRPRPVSYRQATDSIQNKPLDKTKQRNVRIHACDVHIHGVDSAKSLFLFVGPKRYTQKKTHS